MQTRYAIADPRDGGCEKRIEDAGATIARNPKPAKCQNIKTFQRVRQKELKKINLDMKAIFLLGRARVRYLQITCSKFGLIATS